MMSLRWPAPILLVSLICLYGMPSCASPPNQVAIYPNHHIIKRDLPPNSRAQADKILSVATTSLSLFKEVMGKIDTEKVTGIMKGLASFASLAPGIGSVISSVISTVLIFIPQEDKVLKEMKKGFEEVNWKLSYISMQISDLEKDLKYYSYATALLRHEENIISAWTKFDDFFMKHVFDNDNDKLDKLFIEFYLNTHIENSVRSLYRSLTVPAWQTSLASNFNELLKEKFKCDIRKIGKYHLHLSTLLFKGMVLQQFYNRKRGLNALDIETSLAQQFKTVFEAQKATLEYCENNYEKYLRDDVEQIARELHLDEKKAIAEKVKRNLDEKYSWYNWVVFVCTKDDLEKKNVILFNPIAITIDNIIVAVFYTLKAEITNKNEITRTVDNCFQSDSNCELPCKHSWWPEAWGGDSETIHITLEDYAKVTHGTYYDNSDVAPKPDYQKSCIYGYRYIISVYYSRMLPVGCNNCSDKGQCIRVLNSNEWRCDCQDGYYGDTCESEIDTTVTNKINELLNTSEGELE
ncbi:SE-cephalotoxin-like [Sardina pilchardus]|uniref:SE-cephalotoxin-like n=1 Tax=Sardina pilchardus TaxID=27697 RepID=UPI002E0E8176